MSYMNIYHKLKSQYKIKGSKQPKKVLNPKNYNKIQSQEPEETKVTRNHKVSKRGIQSGEYKPINEEKFFVIKNKQNSGKIKYRSSWELKFMLWCDKNDNITKVLSEGVKIPYIDVDGKSRNYFPDFVIEYHGKRLLIEIKPKSQTTDGTNLRKFESARKFCEQRNMEFVVLTEIELKKLIKG